MDKFHYLQQQEILGPTIEIFGKIILILLFMPNHLGLRKQMFNTSIIIFNLEERSPQPSALNYSIFFFGKLGIDPEFDFGLNLFVKVR